MAFDISHIMQGGDFRTKSLGQLAAEAEQEARTRNKAREDEIRNIYGEMLSLYSPGGAMEKAGMQQIQRAKVGATTGTMQRDISRGLYGIRPYEAEWEATTGVGARMTLEDMLTRGRAAIMGQQASFIERIEDQYPDLGAVERGYSAMASTPSRTYGTSSAKTGLSESAFGGYTNWEADPSSLPADWQGFSPADLAERNTAVDIEQQQKGTYADLANAISSIDEPALGLPKKKKKGFSGNVFEAARRYKEEMAGR